MLTLLAFLKSPLPNNFLSDISRMLSIIWAGQLPIGAYYDRHWKRYNVFCSEVSVLPTPWLYDPNHVSLLMQRCVCHLPIASLFQLDERTNGNSNLRKVLTTLLENPIHSHNNVVSCNLILQIIEGSTVYYLGDKNY